MRGSARLPQRTRVPTFPACFKGLQGLLPCLGLLAGSACFLAHNMEPGAPNNAQSKEELLRTSGNLFLRGVRSLPRQVLGPQLARRLKHAPQRDYTPASELVQHRPEVMPNGVQNTANADAIHCKRVDLLLFPQVAASVVFALCC